MNATQTETANDEETVNSLRLQLQLLHRELDEAQERMVKADYSEQSDADLLAGEKRILEMVALGEPLPVVLDALCRLVEEIASGCYCTVLLIDLIGPRLASGAAPSLPESFITAIWGLPVSLESGPCGMAAYLNEQVIAPDVFAETRWKVDSWCALAMMHGLRACWSTPITSRAGTVLGTFAILFDEPATPTALHRSLIERFTHIAGIAIERARSEEELKQSEAFLAETRRLTCTGGALQRVATGELIWSEEVYGIYEMDPAEPASFEGLLSRVHPDDVPFVLSEWQRSQNEGGDFDHEHRLLFPDGRIKYLHVVASPRRDQEGHLEYVTALQDVTQRRLAEETLRRRQVELAHVSRVTTLGELTATIAHEVNQPLTAVINNANACLGLLPESIPYLQEVRDALAEIVDDADRASAVIDRIRQLARKAPLERRLLNLKEVVTEVMALVHYESTTRRVVIHTDLSKELPTVLGDHVQLQQVLLNLVVNAMDAMSAVEESKRILIISGRSEPRDGEPGCLLRVQDAGIGFSLDGVDKLFEAFYTTKPQGMGMGLAISRSIIEAHGGRLWAEPNQGAGATFLFHLPTMSQATS